MSLERWMAFRHGDMEESIRLSKRTAGPGGAAGARLAARLRADAAGARDGRAGPGGRGRAAAARGLRACGRADGSQTGITEFAAIAADALLEAGRIAEAERFVSAGEKAQADIGERFFAAELARLRARPGAARGRWRRRRGRPARGDRDCRRARARGSSHCAPRPTWRGCCTGRAARRGRGRVAPCARGDARRPGAARCAAREARTAGVRVGGGSAVVKALEIHAGPRRPEAPAECAVPVAAKCMRSRPRPLV